MYYSVFPEMLHARMLFSCPCDADYLASASHNDEKIIQRSEDEPLDTKKILDSIVEYRSNIISSSTADSGVNAVRNEVCEA